MTKYLALFLFTIIIKITPVIYKDIKAASSTVLVRISGDK